MNITVFMKDGDVKKFLHTGRAGGSWTKSLRHEGMFTIITDEWGREIHIPAADISSIETKPNY